MHILQENNEINTAILYDIHLQCILVWVFWEILNLGALEINIHIFTEDKKQSRPVLPQLELVEGRRPRVSTLLLHYFYAKY